MHLTDSQPIGNFRTLGKRVETIFMGFSGRCSLFPRVPPSRASFFLVPATSKRLLASYVSISFGMAVIPRRNKKQRLCKILAGK